MTPGKAHLSAFQGMLLSGGMDNSPGLSHKTPKSPDWAAPGGDILYRRRSRVNSLTKQNRGNCIHLE